MGNVFISLFNISISAGYMILAVVLLRLLLRKAPKWICGILWAFVGIRLVLPFSVESMFSLIPSAETISQTTVNYAQTPAITSGITIIDDIVNPVIDNLLHQNPEASVNPLQVITEIAGYVWVFGLALMLLYAVFSTVKVKRQVREAVLAKENIYACDYVKSPFILGVFRPKIYIPSDINADELSCIIAHEKAHIKRKDHLWKPLGFVILSVYWFNPLCFLAYYLLCRDIELACDEKVVKQLDRSGMADYSEALLRFSVPRKMITACPIAFGEVGVKERVKSVLNYKKPAFWVIAAAIIACAVTAACFLTNPYSGKDMGDKTKLITAHTPKPDVVSLSVTAFDQNEEHLSITVEWKNYGKEEFNFGLPYCVYKTDNGNTEKIPGNDNVVIDDVLYGLKENGAMTIKYDLSMFDFSKGQTYRLYLNSFEPSDYWVDFSFDDNFSVSTVGGADNPTKTVVDYTQVKQPPSLTVTNGTNSITALKCGYT